MRVAPRRPARSDPARSLSLLWGPKTNPSRSGLTLRRIMDAAIELADRKGWDAVTMRSVADRVGVATMSLYSHVPGKQDLAELVIDATYGELYERVEEPSEAAGGWRGGMTLVADRNWSLFQRHPWLLDAVGARPVLGPNVSMKYEAELRPLDGLGLTDVEMDSVLNLVLSHVESTARMQVRLARSQESSGMTDAEWWLERAPLMFQLIDSTRFPIGSRVGQAAGEAHNATASPTHALTFGLERILDGVAALIAARATPSRRRNPRNS